MTSGPNNATNVVALDIYQEAFGRKEIQVWLESHYSVSGDCSDIFSTKFFKSREVEM